MSLSRLRRGEGATRYEVFLAAENGRKARQDEESKQAKKERTSAGFQSMHAGSGGMELSLLFISKGFLYPSTVKQNLSLHPWLPCGT